MINSWNSGPIRGASHISSNLPCQDSVYSLNFDGFAIGAVSDGHGGKRYFRSQIGSNLAASLSIQIISGAMKEKEFIVGLRFNPENALSELESRIYSEWKSSVLAYDSANPLTDDEIKYVQDNELMNDDPVKRYGCTLLISVLGDGFSFCIQIGDGDIVCLYPNGTYSLPVPIDPRCIDNITTSMCGSEAIRDFRHVFLDYPVAAFVLSSDGVSTSFSKENKFLEYARNATVYCQKSLTNLLYSDLQRRSGMVNCDDVSCAILWNSDLMGKAESDVNIQYKGYFNLLAKQREKELRSFIHSVAFVPKKKKKRVR